MDLIKIKVLIIQPKIPHYRIEFFLQISKLYKLTILHSGTYIKNYENNFKQLTWPIRKIGPFKFFTRNLHKLCNNYDVVISEANIRYLDRNFLIMNPFRKYKWISWGPGVTSSYNKKYDSNEFLNRFRYFIFKHADANIFYSDYPLIKYIKAGIKPEKLFVAPNTTHVTFNNGITFKKNKLIFVGTLYKQKGLFELLDAYKEVYKENKNIIKPLVIVGQGPEYDRIMYWIKDNNLEDLITLTGPIYDHTILEKYFREAYACISPGQAGLTVLTSMGYGTPFITRKNAITGGEIFNIEHGVNGILYNNSEELKEIIVDIINNPGKYIEMGERARQYYLKNRQIENMVNVFKDAVEFVKNNTY